MIDANGTQKTVVVEALGFDMAPDIEARAQFQVLADHLSTFEIQVAAGDAGPSEPYAVPLYNAMLTPAWEGLESDVMPWPWDDLSSNLSDDQAQVFTLDADQVAQVAASPTVDSRSSCSKRRTENT